MLRIAVWMAVMASVLASTARAQTRLEAPDIVQVRGDLYVVHAGTFSTVFLVTPDGVVLSDPISPDFARWLGAEIERRFKQPVRHVVYSHHDVDHVQGAAAFPGATIWAHENVVRNIEAPWRRLAGGSADTNGNGRLERAEARGTFPAYFARLDRDNDGALTPAEFNRDIAVPARTYAGRQTISLGGRTVELVHPGRNHSDDATVLLFPSERAAFGVDFVNPGVAPDVAPNFDDVPLSEWVGSLKAVEALDFDLFVPGHGPSGTKADVVANRAFFEELASAVQQGLLEGRDVNELKKTLTLDRYAKWPGFPETRASLIEAAASNLGMWPDQFRTEVMVTVIGSVRQAGLFRVPKGTTIGQVLEKAGGADERANLKGLRIMRIVGFDRREYDATAADVFLHNDTIIVPRVP